MPVAEFLKDTRAEISRIHWPSRRKSALLTALVVVVSLVVAAYLGALDFVFTEALEQFLLP